MVQDALANDSSCGCTLWHQYGTSMGKTGICNQTCWAHQIKGFPLAAWMQTKSSSTSTAGSPFKVSRMLHALSIFSLDAVLRSPNSHLGESIIQALVPLEWNSTLSATARPRIISGPRGFPVISAKQAMDGHSQTVLAQVFNRSERGPSVKSHSSGTGEAEAVASAHH